MARTPLPARLLQQRMLALLDALPAATSGDVTSVHRARVASRRLREVLPVLAEAAGSPELDRAGKDVRRITRALGPIRELDVALGHLQEIGPRTGASARALDIVRHHLTAERQAQRRAMLDVITPSAAARLRARLATSDGREGLRAPDHQAELRSARQRAARRAMRLRAQIRRAGGLYQPEQLHMVRVAAKKLRYALEVDRELSRSRAMVRVDRIKALQDALGEIHDFEILLEHTRAVQTGLAGTDRQTANELDALVQVLETECRDGHAAYLRDRATIEGICFRIIEAARRGGPTFYLSYGRHPRHLSRSPRHRRRARTEVRRRPQTPADA